MKKKNYITVDFSNATSSEGVTGSLYYVETSKNKILLDCGMTQTSNSWNDYLTNKRKFNFKVKQLDFIFISHLHADHVALLPRLYSEGCDAKIIIAKGGKRFLKDMLEDVAYINGRDAELFSKQKGREYLPIYTKEDVANCLNHVIEYDFNEKVTLNENLQFELIRAGHVTHSAQIVLWITEGNQTKKILYTGDLGNPLLPKNYTLPIDYVNKANLVIGECTYSNPNKPKANEKMRKKDLEKIHDVILDTCFRKHGRVLIPTFAFDRSVEMLTELYNMFGEDEKFNIPIVLDSPLMLKHFKNYFNTLDEERVEKLKKVFTWKNIVQIEDYSESITWAESMRPMVILASSGMLMAGHVKNFLPHIIKDYDSTILFVGYLVEGTLGYKIKYSKEDRKIKIDGALVPNNCSIVALNSFSSHMQYEELINYYSNIIADKLVLVHGNMQDRITFAETLKEACANKCKTTKILVGNSSMKIHL